MLGIQLLWSDLKVDPIIGLFEQVSGNFSILKDECDLIFSVLMKINKKGPDKEMEYTFLRC